MAYKGFDLSGKVALVTGGNGGIGLGMAQAMAEAGANIVIWGTNDRKKRRRKVRARRAWGKGADVKGRRFPGSNRSLTPLARPSRKWAALTQ